MSLEKKTPFNRLRAVSIDHIGLALIMLAAIAVRLLMIDRPLDYDEAYTYTNYASKPLAVALSDYSAPNNHLFHTLLVHLCTCVFGNAVWVIRLPACIAGIVLVPVTYVITNRLYVVKAGLAASAIVAGAVYLVDYSTNARGYTMIALMVLLFVWCADIARQGPSWSRWSLLAVVGAFGMWTVPTMLYAIAGGMMWLVLSKLFEKSKFTGKSAIMCLVGTTFGMVAFTMLLYSPVIWRGGFAAVSGNMYVQRLAPDVFRAQVVPSLSAVWHDWHYLFPVALVWALLGGFVVALIVHRQIGRHKIPPLLPLLFAGGILVWYQQVVPPPRVWIYFLPLYVATAASGLVWLVNILLVRFSCSNLRAAPLWVGVLAFTIMFMRTVPILYRWHGDPGPYNIARVSDYLLQRIKPGDEFAAKGYWGTPISYYFDRGGSTVRRIVSTWEMEVWQRPAIPAEGPSVASANRHVFVVLLPEDHTAFESLLHDMGQQGAPLVINGREQLGNFEVVELGGTSRN